MTMTFSMSEYPRWIYHPSQDAMLVNTADEYKAYLLKGWADSPKVFSETEALKAKISEHISEALRLKAIYFEMTGSEYGEEETEEAPENEAPKNEEQETTKAAGKRGRPKKG
jgi:hypothetical protein